VVEFIQRLKNDPEFDHKTQAFKEKDDFMNFVKSEGFDFTLEQLLDQFDHEEEVSDQPSAPEPVTVKAVAEFIQRLEDDPEFENKAQAFENDEDFIEFVRSAGYDFTLDQLKEGFIGAKRVSKPRVEKTPALLKAVERPILRLLDGVEFMQRADLSPYVAGLQKQARALSPKLELAGGGRRRGIKWQ
jgi:predicted ribosomally synthesized peptide with nif11-like leader